MPTTKPRHAVTETPEVSEALHAAALRRISGSYTVPLRAWLPRRPAGGVAYVIALDAGVLIALFDANDAHHAAAEELFAINASEPMTIGPINQAEVLMRAAHENRDQQMLADLRALGSARYRFSMADHRSQLVRLLG